MFWWLMKYVVLGPLLRLMYRPKVEGLENVPTEGGAIIAPNHQSFLDDFLLPLVIRKRKIVMMAKADYFDKWYSAWFFKAAGCIPVRREGGSAPGGGRARAPRGRRAPQSSQCAAHMLVSDQRRYHD